MIARTIPVFSHHHRDQSAASVLQQDPSQGKKIMSLSNDTSTQLKDGFGLYHQAGKISADAHGRGGKVCSLSSVNLQKSSVFFKGT